MKSSMLLPNNITTSTAGQIDQQLDTAYDIVKEVRDHLEIFRYLYELLRGNGVINANANVGIIENTLDGFLITGMQNSTLIESKNEEPITYILGRPYGELLGMQTYIQGSCTIVTQMTDSLVYFTAVPGVTIKAAGELRTDRRYSTVGFIALDQDTWLMIGDMYLGEEIG